MARQIVETTIKGISSLLMHAYPLVPIEALEKKTPAEQAEAAAYRDPQGNLYVPAINVQRSLVAAATYSKGKGRMTLQKPVAACVMVSATGLGSSERIPLGQDTYDVDARPVVIPATKGRIVRYRPRFDQWELTFQIEYDDALLNETELRAVVDNSGLRVGLLDFRPERKGPFGRFIVTRWEAV